MVLAKYLKIAGGISGCSYECIAEMTYRCDCMILDYQMDSLFSGINLRINPNDRYTKLVLEEISFQDGCIIMIRIAYCPMNISWNFSKTLQWEGSCMTNYYTFMMLGPQTGALSGWQKILAW